MAVASVLVMSGPRGFEQHDPDRRQVLKILRLVAGAPAAVQLKAGDLLLSIDGQTVNTYRQVEKLSQSSQVELTVWRDGK